MRELVDARARRSDADVRLVFVTQRVDPDDPVLGATVAKIAALAERFDEVVVAHRQRRARRAAAELPRATVCGAHARRPRAPLRLGARSPSCARRPRPVAVLAHMCPIYAVLAAPLARPLGVARAALVRAVAAGRGCSRLAARLSDGRAQRRRAHRCRSRRAKVVGIGHGIDVGAVPLQRRRGRRAAVRAAGARPLLARRRASRRSCARCRSRRDAGLDVRLALPRHRRSTPAERDDPGAARAARRRARPRRRGRARRPGSARARSRRCSPARCALVNNTLRRRARTRSSSRRAPSCLPVLVSSPPLRRARRRPRAAAAVPAGRRRQASRPRSPAWRALDAAAQRRDSARRCASASLAASLRRLLGRRGHGARDRASARERHVAVDPIVRSAIAATEKSTSRPLAARPRRARRRRAGIAEERVDGGGERGGVVGRHEQPGLAVDDDLGDRADVARDDGQRRRASPRAARGRSPPSAPGGRAAPRVRSQAATSPDAAGRGSTASATPSVARQRSRSSALEAPRRARRGRACG